MKKQSKKSAKAAKPRTSLSASRMLADKLQDSILAGHLEDGTTVGPERDLMVEFGVSRQTVREALRTLEARGLVEVKLGRFGGSYVRKPNGDSVSRSVDLLIKGQSIQYRDLVAVREAIEPIAAVQAALYRTDADLERIKRLCEACDLNRNNKKFIKYNSEWHLAIVQASHNPLFVAFMFSISSAIQTASILSAYNVETRNIVVNAHNKIYDAIKNRDVAAAMRRMRRHSRHRHGLVAQLNPGFGLLHDFAH